MSRMTDKSKKNLMLLTALAAGAAFFASVIPVVTGGEREDGEIVTVSGAVSDPETVSSDTALGTGQNSPSVSGGDGSSYNPEALVWTDHKEADAFDGHVTLDAKKTVITAADGNIVWESDPDWQVQDFIICDVDKDGEQELLLLAWRHGNFGEHKPFFVEENNNDLSQHIFIFSKRNDNTGEAKEANGEGEEGELFLRSEWMSSAMHDIVSDWTYSEADGLELTLASDGSVMHYAWQGWGLKEMIPEVKRVKFIAFGDVIAHEQIWRYATEGTDTTDTGVSTDPVKEDYGFLFENVKYRIDEADIAAIVQETPFAADGEPYRAYPDFASPAGIAEAEAGAGFDIIACATNHMLDEGVDGLERMIDTYGEYDGVYVLGICEGDAAVEDRVEICECNGIKIALVDYTYGLNGKALSADSKLKVRTLDDEEQVRDDLAYSEENADVTVVFVHWGNEYEKQISDEELKWTEVFYGCGADAVIGSHPHVLQSFELYNGEMPVYYSLGNFVSGQDKTECILGGMASFTIEYDRFNGARISDAELEPVITHQEARGIYTAYLLRDYDITLADRHRLDISIPKMWRMYDE